jgi:membrane-associated phospholipid phosphatase
MRGAGEIEFLQSVVGPAAPVFAVLTQLGDVWLLFATVTCLYWLGDRTPVVGDRIDRHRGALLLALALGALAVTTGLKELLAIPRPPGAGTAVAAEVVPAALRPVYEWAATGDGFGFPSGHAVGTTVVWGGLAWLADGDRKRHLALAAVVVALVGLSRLVLGVHHAADVLAGVVVGVVYLAGVLRYAGTPSRAFAVAAVVAVVSTLANGFTPDGTRLLGATLGAAGTWYVVGEATMGLPSTDRRRLLAAVGLPVVGVTFVALETVEAPLWVAFVGYVALLAVLVALPLAVARAAKE